MSCEELEALAEQAKKKWLDAEQELLAQRGPMLGKAVTVTPADMKAIEEVNERYSQAARNAIAAMTAFLRAQESHREPA